MILVAYRHSQLEEDADSQNDDKNQRDDDTLPYVTAYARPKSPIGTMILEISERHEALVLFFHVSDGQIVSMNPRVHEFVVYAHLIPSVVVPYCVKVGFTMQCLFFVIDHRIGQFRTVAVAKRSYGQPR